LRGIDVFDGKSNPLDEGVLYRVNLRRVGCHFSYLAMDVGSGLDDVTGFLEAGVPPIDDGGAARHDIIVELAPGCDCRADGVDLRSLL
tara:strand:+ start:300 stop:563 length:264 start_codon:yes stop_codon:yes gene_type:complete